jgi:hypothetical protein
MSLLSLLPFFGGKRSAAALLKAQKFGKTKEQKKVIDFFASGGRGGCLTSTMDLEDYLEYVDKMVNSVNFKKKAMEKIGIDESQVSEIAPICLTNFHFDDDCYSVVGRIKQDDNVYAVSNEYSVSWLFFSATQMYVYTYIFDTISNNIWEYCREFFYTDITCFRTIHRVVERIESKVNGCSGCLKPKPIHSDYDVDTLCITVPGEDYVISIKNSAECVNSIYAARAFVREKKYQK